MIKQGLKKYRLITIQVKASLWFLICSFLQKGIQMITTPIFTRLLTTDEFGRYSVFNSWLGILSIFISLNLYAGVYTQGLVKFSEDRSIFSSSLQGLTTAISIIWTIVYLLFHESLNKVFGLSTVQMLAMTLMIWSTAAFSFWAAEQRVNYCYRKLVIVTLVVSFAKPTVGILFVLQATDRVTAYILGLLLVEVIGYTGCYAAQMLRGRVFFSNKYWKYALKFNIPLIPHYLSQTVLNSADRIMIERMVSAETAGVYSLAYSISLIMTLFSTALMSTLSPWIYKKIKDRKVEDIAGVAYVSLCAIAIANMMLIVFAPEAVAIFAPSSYYDAIWIIPPVAMSVFFMFCYDLFAKFEFYFEKSHYIMLASVSGAILNIVLNFVFIKQFGYYAAGYTTLFCYFVYAACHYAFMCRICRKYLDGVRVYSLKKLLMIMISFLVGGFFFLSTYQNTFIRYTSAFFVVIALVMKRKMIIVQINRLFAVRK